MQNPFKKIFIVSIYGEKIQRVTMLQHYGFVLKYALCHTYEDEYFDIEKVRGRRHSLKVSMRKGEKKRE